MKEEAVPVEAPVLVILNDRALVDFSCTPRELEYLGVATSFPGAYSQNLSS